MYKFLPYMTNDYSVGLYDEDFNDIYHSAFGALTEAYEKFVLPTLDLCKNLKKIKVLDICYGIGYNTKALLSSLIDSDMYIDIDCVDIDKNLIELSPFIKSKIDKIDRVINKQKLFNNIKYYSEANKIVKLQNKKECRFNLNKKINILLLLSLVKNFGIDFLSNESKNILLKNENCPFFDKRVLKLYEFLSKNRIYLYKNENKSTFVHNIYYKYVSKRIKNLKKDSFFDRFNLNFFSIDIREFILASNSNYDIIFLDGFTPAKCPCIWTYDFLNELHNHLSNDGFVITYNMSAAVRNAFKLAGFYIGNVFDSNNLRVGTIATKKLSLINNRLSDKQEGLLNTKAGIPYRDKHLKGQNEAILAERKLELENSGLMSASQYLKNKG